MSTNLPLFMCCGPRPGLCFGRLTGLIRGAYESGVQKVRGWVWGSMQYIEGYRTMATNIRNTEEVGGDVSLVIWLPGFNSPLLLQTGSVIPTQ